MFIHRKLEWQIDFVDPNVQYNTSQIYLKSYFKFEYPEYIFINYNYSVCFLLLYFSRTRTRLHSLPRSHRHDVRFRLLVHHLLPDADHPGPGQHFRGVGGDDNRTLRRIPQSPGPAQGDIRGTAAPGHLHMCLANNHIRELWSITMRETKEIMGLRLIHWLKMKYSLFFPIRRTEKIRFFYLVPSQQRSYL